MIRNKNTLVVIGGGAAGFFCAVNAARQSKNLNVILLEKNNRVLSKVKVSGGGRCNVTHACFDIAELAKNYPRGEFFLKKAFHWFNVKHTVDWFEQRGVALNAEADGRMFPSTNSSQTIIDCLIKEANKYAVEILLSSDVTAVKVEFNKFELTVNNGKVLFANFVCVSCGGYPKLSQFNWLQQLQHSVVSPVPSLFTFNMPHNKINALMGVSVPNAVVKISSTKLQTQGAVLITHWGLSGPAVLKLSAKAARELAQINYNFTVSVNWLSEFTDQSFKQQMQELKHQYAPTKIGGKNFFALPNRLWHFLLLESNISLETRWADITTKQINTLTKAITNQEFTVQGKTTFKEEFVTCGGINLSEIDVNTMQSKKINNLFFAGEILDIDGVTGGFNFQNAWTTGWIAANAIAKQNQ